MKTRVRNRITRGKIVRTIGDNVKAPHHGAGIMFIQTRQKFNFNMRIDMQQGLTGAVPFGAANVRRAMQHLTL